MAIAKKEAENKTKIYNVEVTSNPKFCGVDVAGVQFANGQAQVTDEWIAEWYRTHEGYKVTEVEDAGEAPAGDTAAGK